MRNMEKGKNISMYRSSIKLKPAGPFGGNMVVSMRTILKSQFHQVFVLSAQYPTSHGAPIHIGNPARIGIGDISAPSWGDPTSVEGEVPVFWACGFSVTEAVKQAGVYRNHIEEMMERLRTCSDRSMRFGYHPPGGNC